MTRTEARLILSKSMLTEGDAPEREAVAVLGCGALDDLESIARSLEKIAARLELVKL